LKITKGELTKIINMCWEAVEESAAGKILTIPEGQKPPNYILNHVGFQTFIAVLNSLLPKNVVSEIKEPPENWRGGAEDAS
jgi:hypothetical protein